MTKLILKKCTLVYVFGKSLAAGIFLFHSFQFSFDSHNAQLELGMIQAVKLSPTVCVFWEEGGIV